MYFSRPARVIVSRADQYIFKSQAGSFFAALLIGWYGLAVVKGRLYAELLAIFPSMENSDLSHLIVSLLVLGFITAVTFSVLKIGKAVISVNPERVLCLLVIPIYVVSKIFAPLTILPDKLGSSLIRRFGLRHPIERELAASADEISEIIDHSMEAGKIETVEGEIIQSAFTLSDTNVHEVMVPRTDVVWVEETASLLEIVKVVQKEGVSRVLVAGKDLDDVRGVLLAKDLVPLIGAHTGDFKLTNLLRLPYFVPSLKRVDDLLKDLRLKGIHFAVVLDEHGGVDGIITMEDLIEEIVGDIFDEFDVPAEDRNIREVGEGEIIVDGGVLIDDLNHEHGFELPTGEYHTLAGLVFNQLGRIPQVGEVLESEGISIKVEQLDQNRIVSLRISRVLAEQLEKPKTGPTSHKAETAKPAGESNEWESSSADQPRVRAVGSK